MVGDYERTSTPRPPVTQTEATRLEVPDTERSIQTTLPAEVEAGKHHPAASRGAAMTIIESVAHTAAYDAEIAAQDDDELFLELDAVRMNLRLKKLSYRLADDCQARARFKQWERALLAEIFYRALRRWDVTV